jgi:hypothetical protein
MSMGILRTADVGLTVLGRLAAAAVVLTLAACEGLLKVSNPGALQEGQLADPANEQFVINGAIGEFQVAYVNYAFWSGVLADEVFMDHANPGFREFSLHAFNDLDPTNESVYSSLQRARQAADDAADRVKKMQGANAASSLNVARALVYAGYAYVLLGEGFCEAPVNLSAALPSHELLTRGIARFDEGIMVATAARVGENAAVAQDLIYLAQVGAARASVKTGDTVRARAYAAPVPDAYARLAYYSANSPRENNPLQIAVRQLSPFLGMHPVFQGRNDVRAPQPAAPRRSLNAHQIYPPLKPSMYAGWTATAPAPIEVGTHIRFATGLEARYIGIESDGPNAAMLTFVNARRAVAGKPQLNLTGSALLAEFRVQRSLDFYLTGQRLGDLRRYAAAGTNLFPSGPYPVSEDLYGTARCFLIPQSERAGNPNL